jgi:hypothetical protein
MAFMSQTGLVLDKKVPSNKYGKSFSEESIQKNIKRLTNQLWKLIPMREKEEDWQKQLDTVIIEIAGLNEIFFISPVFLHLLSKLEGLRVTETNFELYRKTIFESISLLQELDK